ncbi:AAA family ATPase (plasmid) [Spiroplasma citri]|nr:AAA family ATPase [Spiroplasma citri]
MANLEIKLFNELQRESKLKNYIEKNISFFRKKYDYILIDTNPSLNVTNINAYSVANSIILISDNSIHSLRAIDVIGNMWETISKKTKNWNNIKAIILNNFDSYSISKDFKFELEQLPSKKNFN